MARMVVIYKTPKDVMAFTRHYFETHVPLAKKLPGLRKYEVSQGPILTPHGVSQYHFVATLHFDDLAAKYNFRSAEPCTIRWSRFHNDTGRHQILVGTSTQLPVDLADAPAGSYFAALIKPAKISPQTVTVYLRKEQDAFKVVGIDRTWSQQAEVVTTEN